MHNAIHLHHNIHPYLYPQVHLYCTVLYCTIIPRYTCTADNGVGNPVSEEVTLTVLCKLVCTVLYCTVMYCTVLYCTVLYCTVLYLHTDTQLISARERCSLLADFCPNMDRVPNSTWTNHSSVLS